MLHKRIEIVSSTEKGLSSMGRESREAIFRVLKKHYADVRITLINNVSDLEALVVRTPDLVFLGVKFIPKHVALGFHDEDKIWISEYLTRHGITHTGSDHRAHEFELNKALAKAQVRKAGLRTARSYVARQSIPPRRNDITLRFPVFIKPTNRGGGAGVDQYSLADNFSQLQSKVSLLSATLHSDSLIEEYLPGREFTVTILQRLDAPGYFVMPTELIAPNVNGVRMLSAAVKASDSEQVVEVSDKQLRSRICELALAAFTTLQAKDYGRIDIRLDAHNIPHFLEANLLPSLRAGYGNFPKACVLGLGLDYDAMILHIVELGMLPPMYTPIATYTDNTTEDTPALVLEAA
jgi:D-alanine-D-alanine ligase